MNQINAIPKTLAEVNLLQNKIKAKSLSAASDLVRKYMKLHYDYDGAIGFEKLFLEGNQLVYAFYSKAIDTNYIVYVIF